MPLEIFFNQASVNWYQTLKYFLNETIVQSWLLDQLGLCTGGVVKVEIYEVDTKIELYVDTFWLGL